VLSGRNLQIFWNDLLFPPSGLKMDAVDYSIMVQWNNTIDTTGPVGDKRTQLQNREATTGQYSTRTNDCNNITTEEVDN